MANSYKERWASEAALISQINIMKLKLEAVYGPLIKRKWTRYDK